MAAWATEHAVGPASAAACARAQRTSMSAGLSPNASAVPQCASAMIAPIAPERRPSGTPLASSAWIAGNATPCAAPSAARQASSASRLCAAASGVSAAAADHASTPAARTAEPP
jgi:hypothetical protein